MNYNEMTAGSELDRLVAELVMGWRIDTARDAWWGYERGMVGNDRPTVHPSNWKPSTNIAHAWEVVEKMRERFSAVEVKSIDRTYACLIEENSGEVDEHYVASAEAPTAPLAVCRAALLATTSLKGQR